MTKQLRYLLTILFLTIVGVGAKADEVTFDAEKDVTVNAINAYYSEVKTYDASDGSKWKATGHQLKEGEYICIGKGGANYLETPEVSGVISSVTVIWSGNASYFLALQTTSGTELEAKQNVSDGQTYTFNVIGSYNQLRLVGRRASGTNNAAAYIQKVVVSYTPSVTTPYNVTLGDDNTTLTEASAGAGVTLPSREGVGAYTFAGWSETSIGNIETIEKPVLILVGEYHPNKNVTLYPVYSRPDVNGHTNEILGQTLEYDTWSYSGETTDKSTYRMFSKDAYIESASFNLSTLSKVNVYAGTFGTIPSSDSKSFTIKAGDIEWATRTVTTNSAATLNEVTSTVTLNGNGTLKIISNGGTVGSSGLRISKVDIFVSEPVFYYIEDPTTAIVPPVITVAETFTSSTTATITCATEGATIKYSFDGENWSDYSEALTITATTTIYAKAMKDGAESEVAMVTATRVKRRLEISIPNLDELNYDLAGETNVNAGQLIAKFTYEGEEVEGVPHEWTSLNTDIAEIDQQGNLTLKAVGKTRISLSIIYNDDYSDSGIAPEITVYDSYAEGGEHNPYTVAQAITYINNLGTSTSANDVYVSGIVSQVDEYFDKYNSITYWISDDGTTTNQMEVYSGKGLNGADFSAVTDLEVGDIVTVKGKVKMYTSNDNSIPEFTSNNQLVSFTRPEKPQHTAKFSVNGQILEETVTVTEGAAIIFPEDPDDINGKTFVGWISEPIDGTTNTTPTYVTSATMGNSDVTYYAVFAIADASGEPAETLTQTLKYDTWTYSGTTTNKNSYRLFGEGSYIESVAFDLSKLSKVIVYGGTFGGASYNSLTIGDGTNIWKSVTVSGSSQTGTNTYSDGTSLTGTNKLRITATAGNGTSTGLRISKVEIFTNEPSIVYSSYCTTVESEEPVVEPDPAPIAEGFYTIKNNGNEKFVNVAGRRTVTFVDEEATTTAPGTVIKVSSNADGQVQILRSQGVDIPGYAQKAMNYVPEIVQLVVEKLNNLDPDQQIMGENGMQALLNAFNEGFDYHLYTEQAEGGIRIYGKTPSMEKVVKFYEANTANVDAKLPMLESLINKAIDKVLEKTGGSGASILKHFSLAEIWTLMGSPSDIAQPTEDTETQKAFLQWVLRDKTRVWNFAYQTAMIYWKPLINHDKVQQNLSQLGDLAQYVTKIENIQPESKYYIVQNEGKLDVFNVSNIMITEDDARTIWTLSEPRTEFKVNFNEENTLNGKYYTTLYTDFAYTLPEGVKAMTVTKVSELNGKSIAITEAIEGAVPAQTPVLLESESADAQTLTLSIEDGAAPTDNLLKGPDYLINEYGIKTAQVQDLFLMVKDILGETFYQNYIEKYEHLTARNAGTVNNKYFFGLDDADIELCTYDSGNSCVVRNLSTGDEELGFYDNWTVDANKAFLVSETNPVKLWLKGDVDRDGDVDYDDVKALVKIVLGEVTEGNNPNNYDFDAAKVNEDTEINIADVTALVNILLP